MWRPLQDLKMLRNVTRIEKSDGKNACRAKPASAAKRLATWKLPVLGTYSARLERPCELDTAP